MATILGNVPSVMTAACSTPAAHIKEFHDAKTVPMCQASNYARAGRVMAEETLLAGPGQDQASPVPHARGEGVRRPVMVRVPQSVLPRIDSAARRLGLSRSGFMLAATLERVERMGG